MNNKNKKWKIRKIRNGGFKKTNKHKMASAGDKRTAKHIWIQWKHEECKLSIKNHIYFVGIQ